MYCRLVLYTSYFMSDLRPLYWTIYRNSTYGKKTTYKGRIFEFQKHRFVYSTKSKLQITMSVSFVLVDVEIFKQLSVIYFFNNYLLKCGNLCIKMLSFILSCCQNMPCQYVNLHFIIINVSASSDAEIFWQRAISTVRWQRQQYNN